VSDVFNAPYDSFIENLIPAVNYPDDLAKLPATAPAAARDAIFKSAYLTDLATNPNNATIEALHGSVLVNDSATYNNNYHSSYDAPFCSSESRKLFDQYK